MIQNRLPGRVAEEQRCAGARVPTGRVVDFDRDAPPLVVSVPVTERFKGG